MLKNSLFWEGFFCLNCHNNDCLIGLVCKESFCFWCDKKCATEN